MLVVELAGTIKVLPPPYTQADPTPFLQLTNIGYGGRPAGNLRHRARPNFATNHYYYVFYTAGTPNRDRLSRFTANATLTGTVAGSELDPLPGSAERQHRASRRRDQFRQRRQDLLHHRRALHRRRLTVLTNPRGKIHRINPDGTVPTDNPFYDGAGPNWDSIWALGLRNPYRAYYDAPTGRLLIGDVGGNDYSTAKEEVNVGVRGANYGWPNVEGTSSNPAYTNPIYSYRAQRPRCLDHRRVRLSRQPVPEQLPGQLLLRRLHAELDPAADVRRERQCHRRLQLRAGRRAASTAPYGDIVYLTEGPDGALYYVDLGYSDISGTFGVSKIRRIQLRSIATCLRWSRPRQPASRGPAPLTVNFSSAGSSDPEGQPLTLLVDLRRRHNLDGGQPAAHLHERRVRIRLASRSPTASTPRSRRRSRSASGTDRSRRRRSPHPRDGAMFRAGDVISFSGHGDRHRGRHAARRARSPGTSTSCTKATCIPGLPSPV